VSEVTATGVDLTARLEQAGALLNGHFRLSSGRHSDRYVQCARLLCVPRWAEEAGAALGDRLAPLHPQVVVGPAMGGLVIAHEVARRLDKPAYFVERRDGAFALRRFELAPGTRVVVVEDVVTTGGSAKEAVEVVRGLGAEVVGVGSIVRRAADDPFDVPYESLLHVPATSWDPAECPLCEAGDEAVKPGSRPDR